MDYLIVDAYNIINAWNDIFDLENDPLEDSREKLLNILSNFQGYKKTNIIVVFDAHLVEGSQQKLETYDNLKIVFTKENETADSYIERLVYNFDNEDIVRVATSDYLEQTTVLSSGGARLTPRELRREIEDAGKSITNRIDRAKNKRKNTLMSYLDTKIVEKLERIRRGD